MNVASQSVLPTSAATTGTTAAIGVTSVLKQVTVLHQVFW